MGAEFYYSSVKIFLITLFLPICNMMALCSSVTLLGKQFERSQKKSALSSTTLSQYKKHRIDGCRKKNIL